MLCAIPRMIVYMVFVRVHPKNPVELFNRYTYAPYRTGLDIPFFLFVRIPVANHVCLSMD